MQSTTRLSTVQPSDISKYKINPSEWWRILLLVALPLNQILTIEVGGTFISLSEYLIPFLLLVLGLLALRGTLPVQRHLVRSAFILGAIIICTYLVVILVHDESRFLFAKLALSQVFVFLVYVMFSRSSPKQAQKHLILLAWIGGIVAILTIGTSFQGLSTRLDSPFWGRSNYFGAALLAPIAAATIAIRLYRRRILFFPLMASLLAVLLTQSRGSLMLAAILIMGILLVSSKHRFVLLQMLAIFTIFSVVLLLALPRTVTRTTPVVNRFIQVADSVEEYIKAPSDETMAAIMANRLLVWRSALEQIERAPWTGEAKPTIYTVPWRGAGLRLLEDSILTFHSWALNITALYGIPILFLNIIFIALALSPYWRARSLQMRMVRVMLVVLIIYGLAEPIFERGFLSFSTLTIAFWIMAGTGIHLPDPTPRPIPASSHPIARKLHLDDRQS